MNSQALFASLAALAAVSRGPHTPSALFGAASDCARQIIGHRLCTVMRFHPEEIALERLFTSAGAEYPVGGRKSKRGVPWGELVLIRGEQYVGRDAAALRWAFDDHATLAGMGLGAVINTPVLYGGRCLGTFNILDAEGSFSDDDIAAARLIAQFLVPALS
ncbi:GAF domain-containing protein [Sphingopyxis sp. J-6]|uniref:GAF domain-containing protein n=1 Tax=Sphingopyxis sp. J-6 TaxID=3122054 RepID=UPI0039845260